MTRPQIIRADTIDLQDHDAPSAKDHKHPSSALTSGSRTNGPLAPHQAETIREVQEERAEEEARSPRVSWAHCDGEGHGHGDSDHDLQQYADELASGIVNSLNGNNKMQQHDALAIAQNGGVSGHPDDEADHDQSEEGSDDDMMDKISSSPSIEDGAYPLPPVWPARIDSLRNSLLSHDSSPVLSEARSSSPYLDLPEHPPLQLPHQRSSKASVDVPDLDHLLPGECTEVDDSDDKESDDMYDEPEFPFDLEQDPQSPDLTVRSADGAECDMEPEDPLYGRDSAIDLRIEDFSLSRVPSPEDGSDDEEIISPYEFLIPYVASDDEEEEDDFSFIDDPRFIDSGWGGECLRDSEDIDFEFVYALHTFVATVEGQANATKGDTMVLLDDSNSYWWLVRVVKDSSIGYLPAEHIETPTERLARLNKHRNVDLSATMLGDQSAPSKKSSMNPMKRRKTKTVTFTAPTYVDYSDFDYSDEEGDDEEMQGQSQATEHEEQQKQQAAAQQAGSDQALEDESAKVEPLKPRNQKQTKVDAANTEEGRRTESALRETINRNSDEFFDGKTERTTKNGTVRNTDSFFKDETIETKKITLTPGLLRDDNDARTSNDSKDLRQRPSFEKELVPDKVKDDKKKKEKKEKEKKPNAIRSFFSRKDKKKSLDDDDDSFGKQSLDAAGGFGDGEMVEEPEDMESSPQKSAQRSTGKLQKQQPRGEGSPTRKPAASSMDNANLDRGPPLAAEVKTNNMSSVPPATLRLVDSEREKPEEQRVQTATGDRPKTSIAKAQPKGLEPKPAQALKSKSRVELDDFDSSDEEDVVAEPTRAPPAEPRKGPSAEEPASPVLRPSLPGSFPDSTASIPQQTQTAGTRPSNEDRLSESPVEVSPITPSAGPPALTGGTLDQDAPSPLSSSSPELINDDTQTPRDQASMTAAAPTTTTPTWNDASLRAFFDSGSEIRDLLVVVYDKSDVAPVGPNHPIASALFREQNAKLAEISTQLDNMLGDWLARKQRLRGTV
ncbi:hypothetical protein F5Y17DRAFT_466559 [Xylariaceae sp. FL0594]|nr:hypothetical protein F5Y17DRAFT_466559 [Xylariaceae sp. FL0594]